MTEILDNQSIDLKTAITGNFSMTCDYYIINGSVNQTMENAVTKVLQQPANHKTCSIFLSTFGGSGDSAYKIGRLFQRHYQRLRFIVNSECKSAGTILCVAGHELLMSETGELGPLDVQIIDGIKSSKNSGLDFNSSLTIARREVIRAFIESFQDMSRMKVSRTHAIESAGKIAQSVASSLYSQIDPVQIAAMQRSITIAMSYGLRLAQFSQSITKENLNKLITNYPSHGFCIDRDEAKTLFKTVKDLEADNEVVFILEKIKHLTCPIVDNSARIVRIDENVFGKNDNSTKTAGK